MPSKRDTKGNASVKETVAARPSVNWPSLQPLVPPTDLHCEIILPAQILIIRNFFTSTLCKKFVAFLSDLPLSTTPSRPKQGEAARVNDRFQVDDFAFAQTLWQSTALQSLVLDICKSDSSVPADIWGGDPIALNGNIRVYRYSPGQFFAPHYDDSNNITLPTKPPTKAKTTWTLLIYLTGASTGCVGGETVFYLNQGSVSTGKKGRLTSGNDPIVIDLEVGTALLHKHGSDCLLHEGRKVTQGAKWILRSDICIAR